MFQSHACTKARSRSTRFHSGSDAQPSNPHKHRVRRSGNINHCIWKRCVRSGSITRAGVLFPSSHVDYVHTYASLPSSSDKNKSTATAATAATVPYGFVLDTGDVAVAGSAHRCRVWSSMGRTSVGKRQGVDNVECDALTISTARHKKRTSFATRERVGRVGRWPFISVL